MLSNDFLDELRGRTGLSDVVGKRVHLKKAGGRGEWAGLCPFHNEKTPSFTLNDDKGFYHCFGCGEHGSVFDFVMKTDGLSFLEAVERLAAQAGMEMPRETPEARAAQEKRKTLVDVTEAACAWFERQLQMPEGKAALDYLHGRGLDDAIIRHFRLGFAPDTRGGLKGALSRDGFDEALMIEAGLLIAPDDGASYDRFRGRVMFPIADRKGQVIAFGGRIMGDGEPKYLNSPETPIFHKGRVLYALNHALGPARKSGRIVVAEGYMDVIALHKTGIEEAVAPLGTALTEEHLQELWRVAPEPVLCFDGDNAGARAAGRAAERALPHLHAGIGLRFAELPKGEDPDTLIRTRGVEAMGAVLSAATALSELIWRTELGGTAPKTPEARAALQARLYEHVRRIGDPTLRAQFQQSFRERLWALGRVEWTGRRAGKAGAVQSLSLEGGQELRATSRIRAAGALLLALLRYPALYDDIGEALGELDFTALPAEMRELRTFALRTLAGEPITDATALDDMIGAAGLADVLAGLRRLSSLDAAFADPTVGRAQAVRGWFDVLARFRDDRKSDVHDAAQALLEDFNQDAWDRLRALKAATTHQDKEPVA